MDLQIIEMSAHLAGMVLIFLGIFVIMVSAISLFRLPDLYLRASGVGTSAGLGVATIVVGALLVDFSAMNLVKALIAVVAQLLTSAVGSMAIARSGYLNNSLPAAITHIDDLRLTRRDAAAE
ncbi:cation:proton antiporter [Nesterenkonia xinjiangensis]|uniref:Multicomponent Na+:H+ antiporter subunit G n=1 Tax=Nesterenkonia xinjiangensis TaxID=225327 RepID=A0A7Z0KB67_9MICC|nr:monovalent cation/H(+) antiporter subunit G [Nesterenkonia xinjiangensis]NYJ78995.1 multicomponent Na+:H+ antiporter subunit G [Nesterenkonia xinjiangensis]